MDHDRIERLAAWLARPEIAALDPARIAALVRALAEDDPPVTAGRWGTLVGFDPGPGRRRLVQFDRRGHLVAAFRWRHDGALAWARCLTARGDWVGIEPGAGAAAPWGGSDRVWRVDPSGPWIPRAEITVFQSLDYERLDRIPPLAEPRRLPAGAGTAILDLLAALMKDQGVARVRYRGPYPTEHLFTALLESFRYDPAVPDPLDRFLDGGPLDWLPAPHERHQVTPAISVQLREEIDKVVMDGTTFYRPDWQGVIRREPRVVRSEGDRVVCSLWALGRSIEDRLVLDRSGEPVEIPAAAPAWGPPAPLPSVWVPALADVIAREGAPALAGAVRDAMAALTLRWGPVDGDLLREEDATITLSRRLRDAALTGIGEAPAGEGRVARAAQFVLEVARLLAPAVRLRAQMRLEEASPEEQRRALLAGEPSPPLSESVGRLIALIAAGSA